MFKEVSAFAAKVTDPTMIAAVGMAAAAFIAVVGITAPYLKGDKLTSRMKSVSSDREALKRKSRAAILKDSQTGGLRREDKTPWKRIVEKLDLKKALEDPNVEEKLLQAGLRGPQYLSMFYFARFALPIGFFILALLYMVLSGAQLDNNRKLLIAVAACAFGFYLPNIIVSNMGQKRRASIIRAFPDALDLLLICVESGMSIEAAFARVSEEIGTSSIELAEELGLTNAELAYLQDRRVAYENLSRRTNHPGVKAVSLALQQAERYGTPLGTALRTMAKENRDLRMTEAEKKAAALPAQLTVPMIIFFLPVLFIVILSPAYIKWQNMQGREQQVERASGASAKRDGNTVEQAGGK
jgi:tight adherence protein C